jgi:hypothetical protein
MCTQLNVMKNFRWLDIVCRDTVETDGEQTSQTSYTLRGVREGFPEDRNLEQNPVRRKVFCQTVMGT